MSPDLDTPPKSSITDLNEPFSFSGIAMTAEALADGWTNGLKAPSSHYEQRSKFRQQAAPYNIRLN